MEKILGIASGGAQTLTEEQIRQALEEAGLPATEENVGRWMARVAPETRGRAWIVTEGEEGGEDCVRYWAQLETEGGEREGLSVIRHGDARSLGKPDWKAVAALSGFELVAGPADTDA